MNATAATAKLETTLAEVQAERLLRVQRALVALRDGVASRGMGALHSLASQALADLESYGQAAEAAARGQVNR